MKKTKLVLLFSSLFLLAGTISLSACKGKEDDGGDDPVDPIIPDPTELDPEVTSYNQTYYFHIDYWHSDENLLKKQWWRGYPLATCPEECVLTNDKATDPLFPVFLGWSEYSSSIDDTMLWDFATDYRQTQTVHLYGIWVAND